MSDIAPAITPLARPPRVLAADRVLDFTAAAVMGAGATLFIIGRRALTAIAEGHYALPHGSTWVARADLHNAQTTWGMWLVCAGIAVGVCSSLRHAYHTKQSRSR